MIFIGVSNGRRIFYGWSPNGWDNLQFSPTPLVNREPDGLADIAGSTLFKRNGTTYVAYHGNDGKMRITEVGNAFDRENHLGVFHSPIASDNGRTAAPLFGTEGGKEYMFTQEPADRSGRQARRRQPSHSLSSRKAPARTYRVRSVPGPEWPGCLQTALTSHQGSSPYSTCRTTLVTRATTGPTP